MPRTTVARSRGLDFGAGPSSRHQFTSVVLLHLTLVRRCLSGSPLGSSEPWLPTCGLPELCLRTSREALPAGVTWIISATLQRLQTKTEVSSRDPHLERHSPGRTERQSLSQNGFGFNFMAHAWARLKTGTDDAASLGRLPQPYSFPVTWTRQCEPTRNRSMEQEHFTEQTHKGGLECRRLFCTDLSTINVSISTTPGSASAMFRAQAKKKKTCKSSQAWHRGFLQE